MTQRERFAGARLAVVFLAVVFLAAGAFFAAVFLAVVFLAVVFFAAVLAFLAGALASFLAPLMMARNSAPGLNAGTTVFFTLTWAPVAGLRAMRAARWR